MRTTAVILILATAWEPDGEAPPRHENDGGCPVTWV